MLARMRELQCPRDGVTCSAAISACEKGHRSYASNCFFLRQGRCPDRIMF